MGRDIRHSLRRFGVELACISGDSCSILAQHTANLLGLVSNNCKLTGGLWSVPVAQRMRAESAQVGGSTA